MNDWTAVGDALPEDEVLVIGYSNNINGVGPMSLWHRDGVPEWSCDCGRCYDVTHWQPLPEPPE